MAKKKVSEMEMPKKGKEEEFEMEEFDMGDEMEGDDEMDMEMSDETNPLADFSTEELLAELETRGEMDQLEGEGEEDGEFEEDEGEDDEDDEFMV